MTEKLESHKEEKVLQNYGNSSRDLDSFVEPLKSVYDRYKVPHGEL
ncbi:MAG: hypothetical protein MJ250_05595 [Alphaproteobacteria bacterium]|nr:hypothetical protein [Alphaproteobacteria bacterium]